MQLLWKSGLKRIAVFRYNLILIEFSVKRECLGSNRFSIL